MNKKKISLMMCAVLFFGQPGLMAIPAEGLGIEEVVKNASKAQDPVNAVNFIDKQFQGSCLGSLMSVAKKKADQKKLKKEFNKTVIELFLQNIKYDENVKIEDVFGQVVQVVNKIKTYENQSMQVDGQEIVLEKQDIDQLMFNFLYVFFMNCENHYESEKIIEMLTSLSHYKLIDQQIMQLLINQLGLKLFYHQIVLQNIAKQSKPQACLIVNQLVQCGEINQKEKQLLMMSCDLQSYLQKVLGKTKNILNGMVFVSDVRDTLFFTIAAAAGLYATASYSKKFIQWLLHCDAQKKLNTGAVLKEFWNLSGEAFNGIVNFYKGSSSLKGFVSLF